MLSYVIEHKGKINKELKKWIEKNGYRLINVQPIVGVNRKEVLIVNYDSNDSTTFYNKKQVSEAVFSQY